MKLSIIDYILPEDLEVYNAIIERAAEAKSNAPRAPRAARGPLTPEQAIKRDENRLIKLMAKLEAAKAAMSSQE